MLDGWADLCVLLNLLNYRQETKNLAVGKAKRMGSTKMILDTEILLISESIPLLCIVAVTGEEKSTKGVCQPF